MLHGNGAEIHMYQMNYKMYADNDEDESCYRFHGRNCKRLDTIGRSLDTISNNLYLDTISRDILYRSLSVTMV